MRTTRSGRRGAALAALVALIAVTACEPGTGATPDASTAKVNASHTSHSTTALPSAAGLRWAASFPGFLVHHAVTSGSRVFVAAGGWHETGPDQASQVVALRKSTGEVLWSAGGSGSFRRYVAATPDSVITIDGDGVIERLDPATGERVWIKDLIGTAWTAPVPFGNVVYVATNTTKGLYTALDLRTGKTLWATEADGSSGHAAPSVRDDGVYAAGACGDLTKLRRTDGAVLWHHDTGCSGSIVEAPAVAGNRIWWTDGNNGPKPVFDTATGEQTGWLQSKGCSPIVTADEVITTGAVLEAVGPTSGRLKWSRSIEGERAYGCVLSAGSRLYLLNRAGRLVTIDRATGRTISRRQLPLDLDVDQGSPIADTNIGGGLALYPVGDQLVAIG